MSRINLPNQFYLIIFFYLVVRSKSKVKTLRFTQGMLGIAMFVNIGCFVYYNNVRGNVNKVVNQYSKIQVRGCKSL